MDYRKNQLIVFLSLTETRKNPNLRKTIINTGRETGFVMCAIIIIILSERSAIDATNKPKLKIWENKSCHYKMKIFFRILTHVKDSSFKALTSTKIITRPSKISLKTRTELTNKTTENHFKASKTTSWVKMWLKMNCMEYSIQMIRKMSKTKTYWKPLNCWIWIS